MHRRIREDATRLAQLARVPAQHAARLIGAMFERHHEALRLFCGDDGEPKAEALPWLARIARENFVERTTFVAGDRDAMLKNEGRRELALEILQSVRIDRARLEQLHRQAKEAEHD